ncbi:hypothetical protein D3C86_1877990 [compost metagenome]
MRWLSLALGLRARATTDNAFLSEIVMMSRALRATVTSVGLAASTTAASRSSLSGVFSCTPSRISSSACASFSTLSGRSIWSSGPGYTARRV